MEDQGMALRIVFSFAAAFLSASAGTPALAVETAFLLKGRALGQSTETACQGASVESQQELLRTAGIDDLLLPAESCQVYIDSIAGVSVAEPVRLLFWDGKLIRVAVRFGLLELRDLAGVRSTLINTYGTPAARRSALFRTDAWKRPGELLELEQTNHLPSDVGLYLTNTLGWRQYESARKKLSLRLDQLEKARRAADLKN
jgi:hypothetical protein